MKHLDLFSGIGGFALAAKWIGWETIAFCERDKYAAGILQQHWPDVPVHDDIRNIKQRIGCDIITGGFPCQPFSVAGKQKSTADDRYLWPEMLRIIAQERPAWVIGENVTGIISLALDQVLSDLEGQGYTARPFIIPAVAVDAPHRRDRVWIVAHSDCIGRGENVIGQPDRAGEEPTINAKTSRLSPMANADEQRWHGRPGEIDQTNRRGQSAHTSQDVGHPDGKPLQRDNTKEGCGNGLEMDGNIMGGCNRPEEKHLPVRSGQNVADSCSAGCKEQHPSAKSKNSGFSPWGPDPERPDWPAEPRVGRVAHGIPNRVDRIKALGNAIVPQVAYQIFKAINAIQRD